MDYWLKQTKDNPLYPDLEWEKPVQKSMMGQLLIIGGNLHGFAAPAQAFQLASEYEIGQARVIMPDALKKTVKQLMPEVEYAPSTLSGSFSVKAYDPMVWHAHWAEALFFVGDNGRNSETVITIDKLVQSLRVPCIITRDAADSFTKNPGVVMGREQTYLVVSFSQLQKLGTSLKIVKPFTLDMPLRVCVDLLHEITETTEWHMVTKLHDMYIYAHKGTVLTSPADPEVDIWRLQIATKISVNLLHYPNKSIEAIATSFI